MALALLYGREMRHVIGAILLAGAILAAACGSSSSSSGSSSGSSGTSSSSSGGSGSTPPAGPPVEASSFDQTCTVDTDCVAVWQGTGVSCCGCPNGAINKKDLPKYQQATKGWQTPDCSGLGCAGCATPAPVQCAGGACAACTLGGCPPKDSGAD
jgi:hypothetical protein